MPRLTENLWVGGANSAVPSGVKHVLNVAQDLRGGTGWPEVEYAQVGLIDGPGNHLAAYHAAVLALYMLMQRGQTMVFCHGGGRSMAVSIMYLQLAVYKRGWDGWVEVLAERVDADLPVPHNAHKAAFDKINWNTLSEIIQS